MSAGHPSIDVNGRRYQWPIDPVVVVCIDGSEPSTDSSESGGYIERAVAAGCMPFLKDVLKTGTNRLAHCVVPSFTNPNNISIVTGVPPAIHGICGNYFYDRESGAEVMMNDPEFLRSGTIFEAFQRAGAKIGVITAKDKLRRLLGNGLDLSAAGSFCFSAERADDANLTDHGIEKVLDIVGLDVPSVYSAELSEFVFAAGVALMETYRPDILYLSTTDYVQHKHAPGSEDANSFYRMMDGYFARLDALGVVLALTADHGMKAKHDANGDPDVIYLQAVMDDWLGENTARVICPITDPYVVHHGALGGFATIYLPQGADVADAIGRLSAIDGIDCALDRGEGCRRFELPEDRVGDIIVIATANKVLGTRRERHDLSGLTEPLRSHGGLSEQSVPLILNRPTPKSDSNQRLRNFDIFDLALNHTQLT